jgi:hypothetical protein
MAIPDEDERQRRAEAVRQIVEHRGRVRAAKQQQAKRCDVADQSSAHEPPLEPVVDPTEKQP